MSVARRLPLLLVLPLLLSGGAPAPATPAPAPSVPASRAMRVAFLNVLQMQNPWQRNVVRVMRAAAHDLGIDFVEYGAGYWPGDILEQARRLVTGPDKPLAERGDAELLQSVSASWFQSEAHRKTVLLLRRYPELQVIWAANDLMALGALRGLDEAGRYPGVDAYLRRFGDSDWEDIDFRAFSKAATPGLQRYDFSLPALFDGLTRLPPPARNP